MEFGIIAMVFFMILFGIIEFGRVFYLYNTVQEVTRCAARAAAVTWTGDWNGNSTVNPQIIPIPQQCLFGQNELVAGWEIGTANVRIRALNRNYQQANPTNSAANLSSCMSTPEGADCIRFVEASVVALACNQSGKNCQPTCDSLGNNCQPIRYKPMFGLIPLNIDIPNSTVVMPAESLGYTP